jgi:hypothetical protein
MRPSNLFFGVVGILSPITTSALELNADDPGAHSAWVSVSSTNVTQLLSEKRPKLSLQAFVNGTPVTAQEMSRETCQTPTTGGCAEPCLVPLSTTGTILAMIHTTTLQHKQWSIK